MLTLWFMSGSYVRDWTSKRRCHGFWTLSTNLSKGKYFKSVQARLQIRLKVFKEAQQVELALRWRDFVGQVQQDTGKEQGVTQRATFMEQNPLREKQAGYGGNTSAGGNSNVGYSSSSGETVPMTSLHWNVSVYIGEVSFVPLCLVLHFVRAS